MSTTPESSIANEHSRLSEKDVERSSLKEDTQAVDTLGSPLPLKAPGPKEDGELEIQPVETKNSVNNIRSVPNGGLRAWSQILGTFFIFFNTWGILNSFGVYQNFYQNGELFKSTPSNISWIGSIQACLLMLVPSLTGPIYDAGYARELIAAGSFLTVLGLMMLSLCTEYWQVILAQGVCIGIGSGFLFVTGIALLSTYFSTRLAMATGLAATGSSIGGMVIPIIFARLQPRIGFPWATRVLGFIALGTLIVANLASHVRVIPPTRRKLFDLSAWKGKAYVFFTIGAFFSFFGFYTVYFYVQAYAIDTGIMGPGLAFYLLTILNAASTFGRFLPNLVADKIGPMNVITPCMLVTSVLCFAFIGAHSTASVIVLVVLFGFFSGSFVSLPSTIYVNLSKDNRGLIGTRIGMAFALGSIAILVGAPIAGAILKSSGYKYIWIYGGCFTGFGGILIALGRYFQGGLDLRTRV